MCVTLLHPLCSHTSSTGYNKLKINVFCAKTISFSLNGTRQQNKKNQLFRWPVITVTKERIDRKHRKLCESYGDRDI